MESELIKELPWCPGVFASSNGKIWKVLPDGSFSYCFLKARKDRYHILSHRNPSGEMIRMPAHRVIGLLFVEGYREGLEINHKNGIKSDNRACNLEWVTRSQNIVHSYKNPQRKMQSVQKITTKENHIGNFIKLRRLSLGMSQSRLAKEMGCTASFVSAMEGGASAVGIKHARVLQKALMLTEKDIVDALVRQRTRVIWRAILKHKKSTILRSSSKQSVAHRS